MADDTFKEGSEEEKKSSEDSFSDDDFGLPDLEFDDLEELDMSGDSDIEASSGDTVKEEEPAAGGLEFDMSLVEEDSDPLGDLGSGLQEGDLDPPETTALNEGMDEVEDVLDSAQLISDRLGDDEAPAVEETPSPLADLEESMTESDPAPVESGGLFEAESHEEEPSEDLFAGIDSPDDLAALGMADEEEVPGTEPDDAGGSLFAADEGDDEEDSIFGSGGLAMEDDDKEDFEPAGDSELPANYKAYTYEESSQGFTRIVVIGIIVIAVAAAGLLWYNSQGGEEKKKVVAKKETKAPVKKPVAKKPAEAKSTGADEAAKKNAVAAAKTPAVKKTVAATPAPAPAPSNPGEIQSISERTARSYVIVGSFIDGDMAMDYAVKLSGEGKSVKIIQPYGKSKRYRVSIADYSTYGDAASQLGTYRSEFGEQVWALKY